MEEKTRPLYIFLIIFLHLGKEKTLYIFKGGGLYNLQRDNNKSKIYIHLSIIYNTECNIRRQCNSNDEENNIKCTFQ